MNPRAVAIGLVIALIGIAAIALVVGPGDLGVGDVLRILGTHLVGGTGTGDVADALVWSLRVPRVLLATLVGAALGVAGALTQGLFRNDLADPTLIGVSSGAAFAAVVGLVLGLDAHGAWTTPLCAAVGAGATLVVLMALARTGASPTALLLAGVAIGAAAGAATTFALAFVGDRFDVAIKVVRWLMGSFDGRGWDHLAGAVLPFALAIAGALAVGRDLDALALGDETAASLGVDVAGLRRNVVAIVAILVGTATAVAGVLGFIGLVIPHVVRRAVGAGSRHVIALSAVLGAVALAGVDTVARVLPWVLPPGVVTSLVGAPLFLWILLRSERGPRA